MSLQKKNEILREMPDVTASADRLSARIQQDFPDLKQEGVLLSALSRKLLVTIPGSEETYVFSYDGHVKAGLDFADIAVEVDDAEKKIRITLPEIRILSVELNEDTFKQYSGGQNLLSQLTPEEVAQARAKAKEKARESAIANGILDNARENAKVLISGHLAGYFDLDVWEIEYTEPETAGEEEP